MPFFSNFTDRISDIKLKTPHNRIKFDKNRNTKNPNSINH